MVLVIIWAPILQCDMPLNHNLPIPKPCTWHHKPTLCEYAHIQMHIFLGVYTHMYLYMYMYTYMCMCMYVWMDGYMCECMCA